MKKIVFILMVVLVSNILFQSCIKNNENNINDTGLNYNLFLKKYYDTSYSFGKSEIIFKDDKKFIVKEILLNDGSDYIIMDLYTNKLILFLDFDYDKKIIFMKDSYDNTEKTVRFEDQNLLKQYKFNYMNLIHENKNVKKMFWGEKCETYWDYSTGQGVLLEKCCKYRFWIKFGCETHTAL